MKTTTKKAMAKKSVMKYGGVKKKLPKAQTGRQTAFQEYMKTPGATATDTTAYVSVGNKNIPAKDIMRDKPGSQTSILNKPVAKNSVAQKALERAFEKTYGMDYQSNQGKPAPGESVEQYRRRMGSKKKGGATKATYKKGGSTFGMLSVKAGVDKNPKETAADRIAGAKMGKKKIGSVLKTKKK